jgi:hypothetical protein
VLLEEGARGLYGGMTAHLLRVVPNSAFMFLTYELFVKAYKSHMDNLLIEESWVHHGI